MNSVDIRECGAMTGAAELVTMRHELTPIWTSIQAEHPVDVLEQVMEQTQLADRIAQALATIPRLEDKRNIVLAGPELVGLEAIRLLGLDADVLVAVDSNLDSAVLARLVDNVPPDVRVNVSTDLPARYLGPTDSILIAVGLRGGYRFALIPAWIASVVRRYAGVFAGERFLVDPVGRSVNWRRGGRVWEDAGPGWVTESLDLLFTGVAAAPSLDPSIAHSDSRRESPARTVEVLR